MIWLCFTRRRFCEHAVLIDGDDLAAGGPAGGSRRAFSQTVNGFSWSGFPAATIITGPSPAYKKKNEKG